MLGGYMHDVIQNIDTNLHSTILLIVTCYGVSQV